jgi:hypothetical protein
MDSTEQQYEDALVELGKALVSVGWRPDVPMGSTLEHGGRSKLIALALLFYEAHKPKLRHALCEGGEVRLGIQVGTEVAAHVAAHLSGLQWLEAALVTPLANYLCHRGLSSFCKGDEGSTG